MTREEAIQELQNCKGLIQQDGQDYLDERDIPLLDMAIEALSAPQTDLISRADAIEAVAQQWLFEASVGNPYVNDDDIGEYRKLAEELFEDVPSADAYFTDGNKIAEWILCSERLPDKTGWYVVTVEGFKTITDMLFFYSEVSAWSDITDKQKVVAWMPLPKPYKGGDGE